VRTAPNRLFSTPTPGVGAHRRRLLTGLSHDLTAVCLEPSVKTGCRRGPFRLALWKEPAGGPVIAFATGASAVASIIGGIVVGAIAVAIGSSFEQFTNAGPRAPTTRLPSRLHPRGLTRHTADRWGSPIGEPFRPHRLGSGSSALSAGSTSTL
jgi:hypothetical protein